jgi:CheY-like chemotaxis protein
MIKTKNVGEPLAILLVEDNEDHAELICRSFEEHQVLNKLKLVHDGAEALDYLFRRDQYKDPATSPQPHVILLDLRLPKVDGLEVLKQIKESELLRSIPVVVLTSSKTEGDINKAYAKHVNSYLTKPVDFDKFTKLLKDLGFYWLAWNQPSTSPE